MGWLFGAKKEKPPAAATHDAAPRADIPPFRYLADAQTYGAALNGIAFTCRNPDADTAAFAEQLADAYGRRRDAIAAFISADEDFQAVYGPLAPDALADRLGPPSVLLLDGRLGQITYCRSTLDAVHIIGLEFSGVFEELFYLSIDG